MELEAHREALLRKKSELSGAGMRRVGDLPLLTLGRLEELPGLMRWGLS